MASLKCGHLSSEVETQHYFPCQEWADTKLPMVRGDHSGSRDEKQCLSQESVLKPSLNRVKKPELSLCQHGQLQNAAAHR